MLTSRHALLPHSDTMRRVELVMPFMVLRRPALVIYIFVISKSNYKPKPQIPFSDSIGRFLIFSLRLSVALRRSPGRACAAILSIVIGEVARMTRHSHRSSGSPPLLQKACKKCEQNLNNISRNSRSGRYATTRMSSGCGVEV